MENSYFNINTNTTSKLPSLLNGINRSESLCMAATPPFADIEQELVLMFLDIRNFTRLMEVHPAREIVAVIRKLFGMFNQSVKKHYGQIIETAGDSFYAVFGMKTSIKDAAYAAYKTANEIFETLELFNMAFAVPYYNQPLEIGVGLHAGDVVIGQFGLDGQEHLTVMGLPVNVASRLQAETKTLNNNLIISEHTYSLLEVEASQHEQRTINLRGVSAPQQVRLAGKPYSGTITTYQETQDWDYLLAISG